MIEYKKITNKEYRLLNPNATDRTALNDFNDSIKKGIITSKGEKISILRTSVISDKFRINFG